MSQAQQIAERVETEAYSLMLPAKSEELRQYLANDGLLSNEEISTALYDDRLTKKALREKVAQAQPDADKKLIDRLTGHLWETHQSVKAAKNLLPAEGIDPAATYRLTITGGQAQQVEPQQQKPRQPDTEDRPMPKVVLVSGNLIANFLHNYKLNRDLQLTVEKLPEQVKQTRTNQPQQQPSITPVLESKPVPQPTPVEKTVQAPGVVNKPADTSQTATQATVKPESVSTGVSSDKLYQWEQVASQLAAAGISRHQLTEKGQLDRLLTGQQTGPLAFDQKIGNRYVSLTGQIRVVEVNGQPVVRMQPVRDPKITRSLSIPQQLRGYSFSPDDRASLLKTGELGKRVELIHPTTGQLYPAYIGADPKTRQLVVTRQEQIKLPKTINGVTLTQTQRELIGEGKAVRLDGLTGKNGQTFSAYVQVSAARRGLNMTSVPATAVRQTTDLKTTADLNRPSDQFRKTASAEVRPSDRPDGPGKGVNPPKPENKPKQQPVPKPEPATAEKINRGPRVR